MSEYGDVRCLLAEAAALESLLARCPDESVIERMGVMARLILVDRAIRGALVAENARLREALWGLVTAFHADARGVEWINVHLDGAAEPVTLGQAPALTTVGIYAARAALGDAPEAATERS